jgi:hypothetical protein
MNSIAVDGFVGGIFYKDQPTNEYENNKRNNEYHYRAGQGR